MNIRHNMMACCGVREIDDLHSNRTPERAMKDFIRDLGPTYNYPYSARYPSPPRNRFRYAIFTATRGCRYGTRFATFITDHHLGEVISTEYHRNPNSGRMLRVWVWTVDHDAVKAWGDANDAPYPLPVPAAQPEVVRPAV